MRSWCESKQEEITNNTHAKWVNVKNFAKTFITGFIYLPSAFFTNVLALFHLLSFFSCTISPILSIPWSIHRIFSWPTFRRNSVCIEDLSSPSERLWYWKIYPLFQHHWTSKELDRWLVSIRLALLFEMILGLQIYSDFYLHIRRVCIREKWTMVNSMIFTHTHAYFWVCVFHACMKGCGRLES